MDKLGWTMVGIVTAKVLQVAYMLAVGFTHKGVKRASNASIAHHGS